MIRHTLGLVVVGALVGASAMFGTGMQAQAPAKKAFNGAVKPIGPYTPGVGIGDTVYLSGQIGIDPASGQIVQGGTEAEARRVMENLGAVLKEAGLGFGHVVKTTIYMVDLAEFTKVNEIYGSYFPAGGVPPARSTVQVAALPRGARIEIDFVVAR
ncbi:MAG: Rid family detoxifying hydrolase [Vicinamibacterales bacterium]